MLILSAVKMFGKLPAILNLAFLFTFGEVIGDDNNCDKFGILLYEEIGCKSVKAKPDDLCPSSYDCNHLNEPGEHCHYQGQKYKNREALPENATYGTCDAGCFCNLDAGEPKFTCASFDCPPVFRLQGEKECIDTYSLDSCCSTGQICSPFKDVATCKVQGTTYRDGEKFSPKGICKKCVCQKGFSGKLDAPFCIRQNCVIELRNSEDIKNNCAPVYEDKELPCCPSFWICCKPFAEESDIFSPTQRNNNSEKTCKFGGKEIKSDQKLEKSIERYGKQYRIKCECVLPALLTCFSERIENLNN